MENNNDLQGLDKAAILFQVLGEALALSMFQNISEADIMRIRIRSRGQHLGGTSIPQGAQRRVR